ncbi:MAG: TatD family hydrolase [Candidatus Marinimicrobia bacterium]|nr:TatD family hydrolase [Candidatus Neomarinimicrobiota bacterium]
MKPKLIDIHCHLDFPDFDSDRQEVIQRALEENIWMITVGATMKGSQKAVEIAENNDGVFAVVGVHPEDADKKIDFNELKELAKNKKVVAIGECGLDYYCSQEILNSKSQILNKSKTQNQNFKTLQKELFKKQVELALELDKPLMIHCRDAHSDVLEILKSYEDRPRKIELRADIHCFTGGLEEAEKYIELGFSISFTGIITFTKQYDEIIRELPLEKIMIETDAPFLAPSPYRGKRNEPLFVKEVAKRIAEIKNISFDEICGQTTKNAIEFFGLS